jgi:hypothetical protein
LTGINNSTNVKKELERKRRERNVNEWKRSKGINQDRRSQRTDR